MAYWAWSAIGGWKTIFPITISRPLTWTKWRDRRCWKRNVLGHLCADFRFAAQAGAVGFIPPFRLWKLCNTRYLLAPAAVVPFLNQYADPAQHGFQIRTSFNLVEKPWVTNEDMGEFTALITNTGPFALIEITNALPRAKLYSDGKPRPGDAATLQSLNSGVRSDENSFGLQQHPGPAAAAPELIPARSASPITNRRKFTSRPSPRPPPFSCSTTGPTRTGMPGLTKSRFPRSCAITSCAVFNHAWGAHR